MNNDFAPTTASVARLVAAAALALLFLSNLGWLIAYSALSRQVIGVDSSATPSPSASPHATLSPSPVASPTPLAGAKGTINGKVSYPAETTPAETVCAVAVSGIGAPMCVDHAAGAALTYSLAVPAGTYHVYASLKTAQGDFTTDYKAYYNQFVTCGMAGNCAMGLHGQYIDVSVPAGGVVNDVNPTDWYALGMGQ